MERNYYTEGFEGFLKEKADQHKMYPSEKVWKNIHRQLHPRPNKWGYLALIVLLLGIGVGVDRSLSTGKKISPAKISAEDNQLANSPNNITSNSIAEKSFSQLGKSTTRDNSGRPQLIAIRGGKSETITRETFLQTNDVNTGIVFSEAAIDETALDNSAEGTNAISFIEQGRLLITPALLPDQSKISSPAKLDAKTVERSVSMPLLNPARNKWDWQLYFAPTVSYRKLSGTASNTTYSYSGASYSANFGYPSDVNEAVTHSPSIGMELGTAMVYNVSKSFRVKGGIQFNYSQYSVKAYSYVPELAPYGSNSNGFVSAPLNVVSRYRNFDGYEATWLKNEHFMISMPIGLEWAIIGNGRIQFNVAGSLQPTYMLNNKAFLISTNLKNYAEEPSLMRKVNINSAIETFLSVNTGTIKWVIGPQFRYQLLSSYKSSYPIKEHLFDYGIKVGVNKTLK